MTWRANPDYKFYPIIPDYQVPDDQPLYLDGFRWEGARRPGMRDVFDRTIRPSEREARMQLRQPNFPISRRIEAFKQRLIDSRRWVDRNDPVDQATVEWMHDLGYEVGQPHPDYRRPAAAAPPVLPADSTDSTAAAALPSGIAAAATQPDTLPEPAEEPRPSEPQEALAAEPASAEPSEE